MSITVLLSILAAFQGAISAAPQVLALVQQAKDFFAGLFSAKAITKAQQDALWAAIDAHAQMVKAGIVPPHWQVEPDPDEVTGGPVP